MHACLQSKNELTGRIRRCGPSWAEAACWRECPLEGWMHPDAWRSGCSSDFKNSNYILTSIRFWNEVEDAMISLAWPELPAAAAASWPCSVWSSPWSSWRRKSSPPSCLCLQTWLLSMLQLTLTWLLDRHHGGPTFVDGHQEVQVLLREVGPDYADLLLKFCIQGDAVFATCDTSTHKVLPQLGDGRDCTLA